MAETLQATISDTERTALERPCDSARTRFTLSGSLELEQHLQELCLRARRAVAEAIPESILEGMLLGGGYGRGEGGVLRTPEGERPYNDLEFYVFLKGPLLLTKPKFQPVLDHCAHVLSNEADIEIELRVTSLPKLRRSAPNMFDYDLMMGHRWCIGDDNLLHGCEHHRDAGRIPLADATRLLLNRCSGLLFARERMLRENFSMADADFVGRNIAKAKLALGDVLLTALSQYHWSCLERDRRIAALSMDLPWLTQIKGLHSEGVEFKLHPQKTNIRQADLIASHKQVSDLAMKVWLWLESRRLRTKFADAAEYAFSPINKCPETKSWRNALISMRTLGRKALSRKLVRYPRERLLNSLPLLLWTGVRGRESEASELSPEIVQFLQSELLTNSNSFPSFVETYRTLWSRFN